MTNEQLKQSAKDEAAMEAGYLSFEDFKFKNRAMGAVTKKDADLDYIINRAMEIYAERVNGFKNVKAVKDDSGHWYVIPNELAESFYSDSENYDFCDSGQFDNKWRMYRTGGDLNLIQLYANIKTTKT